MSEEKKEELKEELKEKEETKKETEKDSKKDSKEETRKETKDGGEKSAPTSLIIEAIIAVAAIILIIVAVVINHPKKDAPSPSDQTVNAVSGASVSVDNSELWTNMPAIPDSVSFNNLTEAECEAEVAAGTMIKLTTESGATVYVHNYDNAEYFSGEASVSDDDVEAVIKSQVLSGYAETKDTGHTTVQNMDSVSVNYVGKIDGVAFEGGSAEGQVLTVGGGGFIPGFEDGMIGMSVGETKDVNTTFPADYHNAEVAGKTAVFTITVNEILGTVTYPELNDQIANEVTGGQYPTAAELRSFLKESMLSDKIMTFLDTDFYVSSCPEDVITSAYESQLKYYDQISATTGMSISDLVSAQGQSMDDLKAAAMSDAVNSARYNVLYQAIAESNGLTVTDADLTALATEYGYSDLESFYRDYGATEETARTFLIQDKIVEFLTGKLN
ncbi:MAG: FKBP-type peptidyl-prolyl cis-trans isomerase [Lachnospiraceae bacterium]|nr:FKBP-type peptidyl-prolyl cis-trans isomerase [Lachnospiraceae bacterium]